ncbi:DUF4191 domain-containing protein [Nocardioides sp. zg-536]|uniref:DUF4191 domain-containing protein n=1 Tax=Nocardioides faecalis TaxID=2803858 RepID=A0A939BY92_9ACTN|nr:DUF4191 domain-containing protein [Nocardioides faecalis]MBM9460108.1 DUF4191 domain-containing protein [Nocardioides faecalis]MBS4754207.1 DUF4191 domain-containing protein [Nocardioides faecalis]QVI60099.1 DUF4191 domain-containing protein [Nocardioides faecalis]
MSNTPLDPSKMSRRRQVIETYKMSRKADPAILWWMLGSFAVAGFAGFALFHWVLPGEGTIKLVLTIIGTILIGLLAMMIVFGRRAQRAAFNQLEGQLGAAARALSMLRRGWIVEEVVGFTKQQDMVHRVIGPPGVVLIGEGNPSRVRPLLASERRKHERVVGDYPVHEVIVGREEGQVPLPKLVKHVRKLGKQIKPADVTELRQRLRALDAQRPKVPIPRGPVPTSMKGQRGNLRGR